MPNISSEIVSLHVNLTVPSYAFSYLTPRDSEPVTSWGYWTVLTILPGNTSSPYD